jgi:hypothetical protein
MSYTGDQTDQQRPIANPQMETNDVSQLPLDSFMSPADLTKQATRVERIANRKPSNFSQRGHQPHCFGTTGERHINLNDPSMLDMCERELKIAAAQSGDKPKGAKEKFKDYASFNDHPIFEGLDNSIPYDNDTLKHKTHHDIFAGGMNNSIGRPGQEMQSLKK